MLGLTATPERTDKKEILDFFGGKECVLGKLDLAWALKNNHLAKPKYHILSDDIDAEKLSVIKNGLSKSELDKTLFLHKKDDEIFSIITEQLKAAGVVKPQCIVFCRNIRHINNFINHLPPGTATIIHSKMDREAQRKAISEFRDGSYSFILTVDIFNEGVDIPEVNSLVFLRSTSSKTIWLQQLGRGLRKTPEKNFVEVFDFVGSVSRILEVDELKKDIQKAPCEDKASQTKDDAEVDDNEKKDIIFDSELDVSYSKYAAEVQKLLEQYQFKLNSKQDCVDELLRIEKKLGRIPTVAELVDEIDGISTDQVVTIFGDYFNAVFNIFHAQKSDELRFAIEEKIEKAATEYYLKHKVVPSGEMIQIFIMEFGIPLAGVAFIKKVLTSVKFYVEVPPPLPAGCELLDQSSSIISLTQENLIEMFQDKIFSLSDLKKLPQEDRKMIRQAFLLDIDFIKELKDRRDSKKVS